MIKTSKTVSSKKSKTVSAVTDCGNHDDPSYDLLLRRLQNRFLANTLIGSVPLFTTDVEGLFDIYLSKFPVAERQYHNCHACRRFIERFGGLVTVNGESNLTESAFWNADEVPEYKASIDAMASSVRKAKITGPFLSKEKMWGQAVTGIWQHLAVTPPPSMVFKHPLLTAGQIMAEKREDFKTMVTALEAYSENHLLDAIRVLESEALYRSEKVIGPVRWLSNVKHHWDNTRGRQRTNRLWLDVATAPTGFCHPRSSMAGTLLDDIAAGLPFADVAAKFKAKMHPLQYQRPTAAPTAGNVERAEAIIERLGLARSLERRFAWIEEIETIWTPDVQKKEAPTTGSVFGHLKVKGETAKATPLTIPAITMTWDKFQRTVLPTADEIEFYTANRPDNYTALVTAAHEDAPPILQWDLEEARNPVSSYVYNGGTTPGRWQLPVNTFVKVTAITSRPSSWNGAGDKFSNHGENVTFILEGAKDLENQELALFPETLKSELREIRSTIKAYSKTRKIQGAEEASACGISLSKSGNWNTLFRVTSNGHTAEYKLDRWD